MRGYAPRTAGLAAIKITRRMDDGREVLTADAFPEEVLLARELLADQIGRRLRVDGQVVTFVLDNGVERYAITAYDADTQVFTARRVDPGGLA